MKIGKSNKSKFVIIIRNNKTNKHKSIVFDDDKIKDESELLNLIKDLLKNNYKNGS